MALFFSFYYYPLQDLISVHLDEHQKTGKMINLGPVKTRVVMTPEWESLLGKT